MLPKQRQPFHPGVILQELYVEPLGLTQAALAQYLQCTRVAINEIVNGKRGITPKMAYKLADAFKTTPELWLNLQRDYDLWQAGKTHKKLMAIPYERAS